MPDTSQESWHFVQNVWVSAPDTLSFVQKFDADQVWIGMRVPYTPAYDNQYAASLKNNANVTIHSIGTSQDGRPLRVYEVGTGNRAETPCVLVYAREHADEQDSSWVAQGFLDFVAADTEEGRRLRSTCSFLVIPLLDPDGAARGVYSSITDGFTLFSQGPESRSYASFFRGWIDKGNRLDVVINLHNLESADGPHLYCALVEPGSNRGDDTMQLHSRIVKSVQAAGFDADVAVRSRTFYSSRLGGWLLGYYGSLHLLYEVNSQAARRHLLPNELRRMGQELARTVGAESSGALGERIRALVDTQRNVRARAAREVHDVPYDQSAIRYEHDLMSKMPPAERGLIDPNLLAR
jgi:hypothetical protein